MDNYLPTRTFSNPIRNTAILLILFFTILWQSGIAQPGPLTVITDPVCTTPCCLPANPCNCSAGVIATGGIPPYTYIVYGPNYNGNTPCATGLCPGTYTFEVRDQNSLAGSVIHTVTIGGSCCKLNCRDTTFCFAIADSAIHLNLPSYSSPGSVGGGTGGNGGSTPCFYDSIWNNAPLVYPVGTTVVKWYVRDLNGHLDSCSQNVIRNPPSAYTLSFFTSPPIIGGVINICNGTPITFTSTSTGISGLLWNFGNGYYSSNAIHTEPASHYPPGTYYDTLTVYDDCGFPHDTAFQVVVDSASGPDIYCISVVCPGDTVTYYTHANCSTYTWGVSGGSFYPPPSLTSDSATVVWGPGPNGTISLSVGNCTPPSTCAIATVKTVSIVPATLPVVGDTVVCAGATVTYCIQCIPGNTHNWEVIPANAGTVTGQGTCCITIQLNPNFFGILTVQVNYNNVLTGSGCNLPGNCSHDNGCGGTGLLHINVKPIFGISGPAKVCPNTISAPFNGMNLTNNTIVAGTTWKLVTPSLSVLTFTTPTLNAYTWNAGPGIYQLTAYAPPGVYCNDSAIVTVEVVNMIPPGIISGPDTVCAGVSNFYTVTPNMNGVNYIWTVTNGVIVGPANGSSVAIQWSAPGGTVSVVQTLTTSPFCVSASSPVYTVVTWPNFTLPVITPSALVACVKSTITYSFPPPLISNGTYTWSVVPATAGNIITANGGNSITINWISNANTPIFVKLKINRCYSDSVMFPITLYSIPAVPNISYAPANPCVNNIVNFSTTSPGAWSWDFGEPSPSNLQNPPHTYANPGNYNIQLVVTNPQGCSDTAKTTINIQAIPDVPVVSGPASVCLNTFGTYTFPQNLFQGANYTWSLSAPALGNIISSSLNSLTVQWTTAGTDTVKIRVQSPCIDTTVRYVVKVNALPVAGIVSPPSACQGSTVSFTGTGGTSYTWSFPGGSPSSSNIVNPAVTYGVAGNYTVSLSLIDANGCTASTTKPITINPLPLALISGPAGVCTFPATVSLTAVVATGYSFLWSPGGSTTSSITTTIGSTTTFSCVVTNGFGCSLLSNSITIGSGLCDVVPGPCVVTDTINYTKTPPVCLSQTFTKTGNAVLTNWTYGDGGSDGAISPVTHTFPYPGIFNVTVWGTANGFDNLGLPCAKVVAKTKVDTIPFDARFEFSFQCNGSGQMTTVFNNTSLYLNSPGLYTWTWFDNSLPGVIATGFAPAPLLLTAGLHNISLIITDPTGTGATCTVTHNVTVPVPISAAFSVSAPICQGTSPVFTDLSTPFANEASRLFNNGDGATSTLAVCSLFYTNFGNINASLTVTDIYGCTSVSNQLLVVKQAGTGTITPGSSACDSVSLTASCCSPYTWSVISPPPSPSANPVYVKTSGYYKVTGMAPNGCPFTAGPVLVTVKQSPVATISGKTQYCQGEALDLKTTVAGTVSWSKIFPLPIQVVGSSPNLNIVPSLTGNITYMVTVTGSNGCSSTATVTINVDPVPASPVMNASGPLTFCQGDSVILSVSPTGATYLWSKSPAPPLSSPANTLPNLTVTASGTYSVIVQTPAGCLYPAIAPKTITVNPIPAANITGDTVVCEGETLALQTTNVGGGTYVWTGPGASGNTNPFIKPNMQLTNAGVYTVVVTNSYGCTNSDTINVIVNPSPVTPVITSNPGGVLCEGQLVVLTASPPPAPPVVYTWSTNQLGGSITVAMAGNYSVTASNQYGCTAGSNVITIHPLPDLSCAPSGCYDFCTECDSVLIPGPDGLFSYQWQVLTGGNFVYFSSNQNIWVPQPGGIYRLLAANQWGCSDSTDTLKIDFHDCCPPVDTTLCVDTCIYFNDQMLNGFIPHPSAPNVTVGITNTGSQGGITDYFVTVQDQPGNSQLLAGSLFNGKWCCGQFCFDYKLIDAGGIAGNVFPSFTIRSGNLGFKFTSAIPITDNNWHTICAPINDCAALPNSPSGAWTTFGATNVSDWLTVLSNVTEVIFTVDYNGATNEISGYDNICLHTGTPQVNAGNDTTICAGTIVTLQATGCTGVPQWYNLSPNGLAFIGGGPIIDVSPTQSTCYVLICCGINACCCDTDTVCINVYHPNLQWPVNITVCVNSAPITLNESTILVYINNTWVPVTSTTHTGVFSGPNVAGNVFTPSVLGPNVITYTYTDSLGCTASVSTTIMVNPCNGCDTSQACQISAGPDQVICLGNPGILHVTNCNSQATWYQLGDPVLGNVFVGVGQTIDIFPQHSACYMVICCNPAPCCCDTDTVCITVNPHPLLAWPYVYSTVCLNSGPVTLSESNIYVSINQTMVSVIFAGGSGVFSGPGVSGNTFTPSTLGTHVITYTYTDVNGCTASITNTITVIDCGCTDNCNCNSVPPPPLPTITVTSVDPDHCQQDGCIHVTFTGCCLLYSYSYFNPCNPLLSYSVPQTNNPSIFCNLKAGTYIIYAQDGCGNLVQQTVVVPLAAPPLAVFVSYTNCTESICVNVEGGCAPYTYEWSNGQSTACISGAQLCTTLSVTVTDSRGCTFVKQVWVPRINFSGSINPTCCLNNGRVCANICSDQQYTLTWNNGSHVPCLNGVGPGTYCATIVNSTGDVVTCCYTLQNSTTPNVSFIFNNCGNTVSAVIDGNGCQNFTYHWDNNSTLLDRVVSPCDSLTFSIITCDGIAHHHGFRVPHVFASISPVNCATGLGTICVEVDCFRCAPYTYDWLTGTADQSNCFQVGPGFQSVCITNACGDLVCCEFYLPPPLGLGLTYTQTNVSCFGYSDGSVTITPNGGTGPYQGAGTISGLAAGQYTFTVYDANGCSETITVTITEPPQIGIIIFYPTGCPGDIISLIGTNLTNVSEVLFNGVHAPYLQVFDSENLEVEVPVGATTGPLTVIAGPCSVVSTDVFTVNNCGGATVNVNVYIEGYYSGLGKMDNGGAGGCLFINNISSSPTDADSLFISLMDPVTYALIEKQSAILHTDGTASANFGTGIIAGNSYYIRLQHRNAVETWSAGPVTIAPVTNYNFTDAQTKAYGSNMKRTFDQLYWAIYSGDIADMNLGLGHQDNIVEATDYLEMENAVTVILVGYYPPDITGDGITEAGDYLIMENNVSAIIYTVRP